ncbi:hypothetical protein NE237_002576 [Protea cynaroides]|uniref:Mediator of RNA polymerase II transcription subunit 18 n=1 Tax=Protea cynaroides TaxID=273540 RepID=A0A9Q0QZ62_9MAGN|nr:hypothetical protein NE237_002576 [Protea cynaroides]
METTKSFNSTSNTQNYRSLEINFNLLIFLQEIQENPHSKFLHQRQAARRWRWRCRGGASRGWIWLQHVEALEILLLGLCGVPKESLRIHELCLKSAPGLGVPTWTVRHVGGAMRGAGADQISVLVRTVVESKTNKNVLRFFYALGYKLDHELLRVGIAFRFQRVAKITVTVTSVNKMPKLYAINDAMPVTSGIQLVEVTAPASPENYTEVVAAVWAFVNILHQSGLDLDSGRMDVFNLIFLACVIVVEDRAGVFGRLLDSFLGRKGTLTVVCILNAVFGCLTALSPTYWVYIALRIAILAGIASLFQSWRVLYVVATAPSILFLLIIIPFISESPRWYLICGKTNQAMKIMRNIAQCNGKHLPNGIILALDEDINDKTSNGLDEKESTTEAVTVNLVDVIRSPVTQHAPNSSNCHPLFVRCCI